MPRKERYRPPPPSETARYRIAGRDTPLQAGPPPTKCSSLPCNAGAGAGHHEAISGFGRFISSPTEEGPVGSVRIEAGMVEYRRPRRRTAFIIFLTGGRRVGERQVEGARGVERQRQILAVRRCGAGVEALLTIRSPWTSRMRDRRSPPSALPAPWRYRRRPLR